MRAVVGRRLSATQAVQLHQSVLVNAARIQAASDVATTNDQITAAVTGDLIAASPELAATIDAIDTRLHDLDGL